MKSWGILGNPSKQQIEIWQNMSHGSFKKMVDSLKKKAKNRPLRKYTIEVTRKPNNYESSFVTVEAFDSEHAIEVAKQLAIETDLEFRQKHIGGFEYKYRVSQAF